MPDRLKNTVPAFTLLLADDDSDDRDFFENVLRSIAPDAVLKTVTDGKQAVDYLSRCGTENLPCCIVIDYNMPQMNAPRVLDWLYNRKWYDGISKFVWSTSDREEHRNGCKNKGAVEYFVKPDSEQGVIQIVQEIVAHCRNRKL